VTLATRHRGGSDRNSSDNHRAFARTAPIGGGRYCDHSFYRRFTRALWKCIRSIPRCQTRQSGFSERLHAELKEFGIRVTAIYPPDFDDTDPLGNAWNAVRDPVAGAKLTNRDSRGRHVRHQRAASLCVSDYRPGQHVAGVIRDKLKT
jgi:hypothetical protein